MTNFEKLKADIQGMNLEEFSLKLGEYVCDNIPKEESCNESVSFFGCKKCRIKWLESEVEENDT